MKLIDEHSPPSLFKVIEDRAKALFAHPFAGRLLPTRSRSRSPLPADNGREMHVAGEPLATSIGLKGQGRRPGVEAGTGTGTGTGRTEASLGDLERAGEAHL